MKRTSIATLKARLSEYLDTVKSGEEVLVTERGRPIARLIPIGPDDRAESRMAELIRTGAVRPPTAPLGRDFWSLPRPKDPEGKVLEALLVERAESR